MTVLTQGVTTGLRVEAPDVKMMHQRLWKLLQQLHQAVQLGLEMVQQLCRLARVSCLPGPSHGRMEAPETCERHPDSRV